MGTATDKIILMRMVIITTTDDAEQLSTPAN
jgi:hypothetical protein